jgi:CelD/BcsL family acetyltransferase involved in cellulose biosynthesis
MLVVDSKKTAISPQCRDLSTFFPHAVPMHSRIVREQTELNALAECWNALAGDDYFCRHDWLANWWASYGRGNELLVVVVEDQGETLAIAPLYRTMNVATGRCLRWLGSNEVCSDYLKPLVAQRHIAQLAEICQAIVAALESANSTKPTRWEMLELAGSAAAEPTVAGLLDAFSAAGYSIHRSLLESCWRFELPSDYDSYTKSLGNSFRRSLKKIDKDFNATGRARYLKAETETDFEFLWNELVSLHQKRRRALGQPGCFSDWRFERFLKSVALHALANGSLELFLTICDDQPLAASIGFAAGGCSTLYQSGIDIDRMDLRPGHLHNMHIVRSAFAAGRNSFDFLRGDESYKKLWRAQPVALESIRVIPQRLLPQFRQRVWTTRNNVKAWLNSRAQDKQPPNVQASSD